MSSMGTLRNYLLLFCYSIKSAKERRVRRCPWRVQGSTDGYPHDWPRVPAIREGKTVFISSLLIIKNIQWFLFFWTKMLLKYKKLCMNVRLTIPLGQQFWSGPWEGIPIVQMGIRFFYYYLIIYISLLHRSRWRSFLVAPLKRYLKRQ